MLDALPLEAGRSNALRVSVQGMVRKPTLLDTQSPSVMICSAQSDESGISGASMLFMKAVVESFEVRELDRHRLLEGAALTPVRR